MGHKGSVVVITGATRGIGRNAALYFAERGYTVVGTGRNEAKLAELEAELRGAAPESRCFRMDVRDRESVREAVLGIRSAFDAVDAWINNAGAFAAIGPTWTVDPDDWVNDVETNLIGAFHCVQAVVPWMLERGRGRIVNVVGGGTVGPFRYGNGYGTSKTALSRFTENLDVELSDTGVAAFAMDPGLNDTDMTRYQRDTEAGRTYLPRIEQLFEEKKDESPDRAPRLAYHIAEGKLDAYRGRTLFVHDDEEKLIALASELEEGDYTLRLRRHPGAARREG